MKAKQKADLVKNMLRSVFVAPEGKTFYCADFASIEARVVMWYAGEEEALEAFRNNLDMYCVMAEKIFKYPCNKEDNPSERNVGKTTILGAGYGMGIKTFYEMNDWILTGKEQATTCIKAYREGYPKVPASWRKVGDIFTEATRGIVGMWMGVTFRKETVAGRDTVTVELPSGRKLFYYEPYVAMEYVEKLKTRMPQLYIKIKVGGKMLYRGTWGGDIFQDIVQATARDLCVYGTSQVKKLGYTPVMTVHDEVLCLADEGKDIKEFEQTFSEVPYWAREIPVSSEGWIGKFYRKD